MIYKSYDNLKSTLIQKIEYEDISEILSVWLRYGAVEHYVNVPFDIFEEFYSTKSFGKYYLNNIKNKFNKMSEKNKPRGINKSSNKTRFINLSIDTKKINKDWLVVGEKGGVWLNLTLMMKPDGEVDRFENLGMIVQPLPSDKYKAAKKAGEEPEQGPIVGNGKELYFEPYEEGEKKSFDELDPEAQNKIMDDLPF